MATVISIEAIGTELESVLGRLRLGETARLVDADGEAVAVLVSLKVRRKKPMSFEQWDARWDALSERVGKAWQGEKNAVEAVGEQRR